MLDDILFCTSVLIFAGTAILAYWRILQARSETPASPLQDMRAEIATAL
jgi:hypothetical protein